MTFRTTLKQFEKRRFGRLAVALGLGVVIISQYQNCTPVGDSTGTGTGTSTAGGGGGEQLTVNCAAVAAPTLGVGPANQTARSGLGPLSGDQFPQNLRVSVTRGYATQPLNDNCNISGIEGVNVNCNLLNDGTLDVDIQRANNSECVSGTGTVTLRVTDTLCAKTSNSVTFQVAVTNVCPVQQKVLKDGSSAELMPARADQFGSRVAMSGNWAVVVAASDDQSASNAGAAFVYQFNGTSWVYRQKLRPSGLTTNSELDSAAIDGNVIALGSPYNGTHGTVFIYRFNGTSWVESQTLTPSVRNASVTTQFYGWDVALGGGVLAVGSPGYNHGDPTMYAQAGAVFVYQDSGAAFNETRVLTASDRTIRDFFGAAVAVSGGRVAVGAPLSPTADKRTGSGKAYVFDSAGAQSVLNPGGDAPAGSQFGFSIDIDGTRVVVGALSGPGAGGGSPGSVITFEGGSGSWVKQGTARVAGENNGDQFGFSVALLGNNLIVGAPYNSVGQTERSGAAYHYVYEGGANVWRRAFKIIPRSAERAREDYFGESVDLSSSGYMLGGARARDESDLNLGAAFFIRIP